MPSSWAERKTRMAISPRLAAISLRNAVIELPRHEFRFLDFGLRILDCGFWIADFGLRIGEIVGSIRIRAFRFRIPKSKIENRKSIRFRPRPDSRAFRSVRSSREPGRR